jgi:uncharacterized membrane protein YsdA (DUF1294 family)
MCAYVVFMAIMSLCAFIAYGIDKLKARRGASRISERRLLLFALVGGAAGALLGMALFRHKTRHAKFVVSVPLFLALHIAALIMLC